MLEFVFEIDYSPARSFAKRMARKACPFNQNLDFLDLIGSLESNHSQGKNQKHERYR